VPQSSGPRHVDQCVRHPWRQFLWRTFSTARANSSEAPSAGGASGTVLGHECHIVAKREDPRTARSVSSLTEDEKVDYADLIEDRHGAANLVLMCGTHSTEIDDPKQGYSVEAILAIKVAHESRFERVRAEQLAVGPQGDVPKWQRKAIRALALADSAGLRWLRTQLGDPSDSCERVGRPLDRDIHVGLPHLGPNDRDRPGGSATRETAPCIGISDRRTLDPPPPRAVGASRSRHPDLRRPPQGRHL
jgi:hypothetical protein